MKLAIWLIGLLLSLVFSYVVQPLLKFSFWYLAYTSGAILIRILWKLRYEVFNEDLKLKRSKCGDKVVIVTGATSGIGLGVANYFYSRGFVVVACYFNKDEPGYKELEKFTTQLDTRQQSMYLVELDVRTSESIEVCYEQVKLILANNSNLKLHALINVAGVGYLYKFQWTPKDIIKNLVQTNLLGPILMTRQFAHLLLANPSSRVVNVSSPIAYIPTEYLAVYGATKAGLSQFTNTLELETMEYGIKTVTILPGNVMRNTSIVHSSLQTKLDKVMPELNDTERQLYKGELERHSTKMDQVERAYKKRFNMQLSLKSSIRSNLIRMGFIATGAIEETQLHLSESFMQSFDNAIRLKSPPKEMYAGNSQFNLVFGSIFETLSRGACRDLFLMVGRSRLIPYI